MHTVKSTAPYRIVLSALLGGVYAVMAATGGALQKTEGMSLVFSEVSQPIPLLFLLFFVPVCLFQLIPDRKEISRQRLPGKPMSGVCLFLLLTVYVLWILLCYPGSVTPDSFTQIRQAMGDFNVPDFLPIDNSSANPYVTTQLFGALYRLGTWLAGPNAGVFLICLTQAVLMALAFSRVCAFVRSKTASRLPQVLTLLFFLVVPVWGAAAQVALKDSLHVSLFVLFFLRFLRMFEPEAGKKDLLLFLIWMFLAAVTRTAAFYIVLACGISLVIYHQGKHRLRISAVVLAFCTLFFLYDGLLLLGGIEKPSEKEKYALQFQQVALVCVDHGSELSTGEIAIIDNVLDFEEIPQVYDPALADPVKGLYKPGSDLGGFRRLWLRLGLRYPGTYLKSIALGSWKYFYPPSPGQGCFRNYIARNHYGFFRVDQSRSDVLTRWVNGWTNSDTGTLFIGPGLYCWLTLLAFVTALGRKNRKSILICLPMIVFVLGLILTPVNGENRYAYPIMALCPVLLCVCREEIPLKIKT